MKQLSKTDFILYLECAKNVWIKWHKPEEYAKFEISEFEKSLGAMGNDVEEKAREMFPGGYLVEKRSDGAQDLTKKLIALKKRERDIQRRNIKKRNMIKKDEKM